MRWLLVLLLSLASLHLQAQLSATSSGMSWTCTRSGDHLIMELTTPTTGWVGVGFNQENRILESDLLLFHVVDGQAEGTDLFVKGMGDPRADTELGGSVDVKILSFREGDGQTYIKFKRPFPAADDFDFHFQEGAAFWLILAYSTHDEFAHHSRVRQHRQVVFRACLDFIIWP